MMMIMEKEEEDEDYEDEDYIYRKIPADDPIFKRIADQMREREEGEGGEVVLLDKAEQLRRADLVRNRKAYPCIYCNALDDKDESKTSKVEYFKHIKPSIPTIYFVLL